MTTCLVGKIFSEKPLLGGRVAGKLWQNETARGVTASPCSLQCRPARGGTEYRVLPFSFLSERGGSERRPPRSPSPGWCKSWFDSRTGGQPERAKQNQRKRGEVSDSPSHVSARFFDFSYLVSFVLSRQARKAYKTRRWPRRTAIYALVVQLDRTS